MEQNLNMLKAARILLRNHGADALDVAQRHADEWAQRGDRRAADLWRVIGSAALAILNRAVMAADKVERHHVVGLMRRTKRRRASNDPSSA